MTDKDLRRLSRAELLDILYEQRKRYEDSLAENQALRQQLEDRTLRIASAGSMPLLNHWHGSQLPNQVRS